MKKIYDGLLNGSLCLSSYCPYGMGVSCILIFSTADKGIYYEAEGTIYTPVILSPKQYEAVMKEGKEERICVNELTKRDGCCKKDRQFRLWRLHAFYDSGTESGKHRERIRPITIFCPTSLIQEIILCGQIAPIRCLKIYIKVRSMCSRERNMSGINILVSRIKSIWKAAKE